MKNLMISSIAALACSFCAISTVYSQNPQLILPLGHSGPLNSVAYSQDGKMIATSSSDWKVKIWDAETGNLFLTIEDFSEWDYPQEIAFSPDGKYLLTICTSRRIILWDPFTGDLLLEASSSPIVSAESRKLSGVDLDMILWLEEQNGLPRSLHALFSPDAKLLLTSGDTGVYVWDIQNRKNIRTIEGPEEGIRSFKVSPDSKYILINSLENAIEIREVSTGRLLTRLISDYGFTTPGSFTPDGSKILTRSDDEIKLWETTSGEMLLRLSTISGSMHCLSPDGSRLLADGNLYRQNGKWVESSEMNIDLMSDMMGQIVGLYDTMTGKLITAYIDSSTIKENLYVGDYLQVTYSAFSQDGKKVVTISDKCRVWDTQKGTLLFSIEGSFDYPTYAVFSPDGNRLFIASSLICSIYNVNDGSLISPLSAPNVMYSIDESIESQYFFAGFSPDGKTIHMVPDFTNYVSIYDAFSGELKANLSGSTTRIFGADLSSDGSTLVTQSNTNKHEVKSWDLKNGKLLKTFSDMEMGDVFYPNGGNAVHTFFYTEPYNITIKSFDIKSGMLLNSFPYNADPYGIVIFSPDEKTFVVIDTSFSAKIFDAKTGDELHTLQSPVGAARYNHDGKRIVTTSWENFARLYDVESGKLVRELEDPEAPAEGNLVNISIFKGFDSSGNEITGDTIVSGGTITAEFSTDGKRLINTGSSWDNTTRIWDVENGKLLNRFDGTEGSINYDGSKVITQIQFEDTLNFIFKAVPVIWDAVDGRELARLEPLDWGYSAFSDDGKNIITSDFGDTIKIWDANTYQLRSKFVPDGETMAIDFKNDRVIFNEKSQLVFYSIKTGEKLFSLLVMDAQDYLFVTPDNYYYGTENAIKKLSWIFDGKVYPYDKFNLQYNRPDIVLQRIGNSMNHE